MATIILEDGPGYGAGIRYVGTLDPGAIGAYAVWLDTTGTPAVIRVRNATNTAWLATGNGPVVPLNSECFIECNVPPVVSGAPPDSLPFDKVYDAAENETVGDAIPAGLGLTIDATRKIFTAQADLLLAVSFSAQVTNALAHAAYLKVKGSKLYADTGVVETPAGATVGYPFGAQSVFAMTAGDTFSIVQFGTPADTPYAYAAGQLVRLA